MHCTVCYHIWSSLLPLIAGLSIAFTTATFGPPCKLDHPLHCILPHLVPLASWTIHCTVYYHIWSPLLPLIAGTICCHIWSPLLPKIAGQSIAHALFTMNGDQRWQRGPNGTKCTMYQLYKGDQMWQYTVQWMHGPAILASTGTS